ncbi:magnesium transporter NIPA-domain-containing protein [Chaetomidium leptoderma]|uniref:Magnesium transporter NIPA-domain-containing protein n=1 Tax=Chaetomidium leptoderma TaxID=669021 RepID=A0AAN6ZXB7_9PEZI|nr:magnesium transporter NIPA-domain-containing protein [Chaetomidium leptoderma]
MASTHLSQTPAADPAPRPDADAILSVASYNRTEFELPAVTVHRSQHDAVRSSVFHSFGQARDFDLGHLGRLPFEIVSLICLELDVSSAFRFSHVNRTTRDVLASIREFRHLRKHALESLCVLMRTGLASHVDVLDLHTALTTQNCALCGAFGGFVFLPTAARCCLTCIASAPEMQVSYLSRLADAARVPAGELERRLPVLHTLPDSRKRIVAVQHGLDALRESGVADAEATVSRWSDSLTLRFQAATSLPSLNRATGEAQSGVSCKGCQLAFESDFSDDHLELRDRFYSKTEFVAHFEECRPAQKLWASSAEGTASAEEPLWMGLGRTFTAPCGRRRSYAAPLDERAWLSDGDGSPEDELQNWSSLIGIITAICGNVLIALALNVQRYAHIRLHRKKLQVRERARQAIKNAIQGQGSAGQYGTSNGDSNGHTDSRYTDDPRDSSETDPLTQSFQSDDSAGDEGSPEVTSTYLQDPYWWMGQVLITVGEMGNFLAYGFAPASIVSPLGVVALVSNCVIAPIFFKEVFRPRDFWGVIIAITGAVTVVLSAKTEETKLGPHEVWDAITTMEFEIYMGVSCGLIALLIWLSPQYGNRTILIDLGLVGLFGGYTALATKGVSSMLSSTLLGAFTTPITYALLFVLLFTAIMQVRYLNKALQRFESTQVIPIQFVLFTLSVITGSAVLYRDFERTTSEQAIKFVGGCLLTFFGVFLITSGRPRQDDDDEATLSDAEGIEETIGLAEQDRGAPPTLPRPRRADAQTSRGSSRGSSRASRLSFSAGFPTSRAPPSVSSQKPLIDDEEEEEEDEDHADAPLLGNPWNKGGYYRLAQASGGVELL